MSLRIASLLPLLFITACAMDGAPPDETSVDQDLTANEIDTSYYSDAAFTHQVGETDLYCSPGKYKQGQVTNHVVRFTWPCNGAGGSVPTCFNPVWDTGGQFTLEQVACPAWLF